MRESSHKEFAAAMIRRLQELLAPDHKRLRIKPLGNADSKNTGVDLIVNKGNLTFVVGSKSSGDAASVTMATQRIKKHAQHLRTKGIPVLAVTYMGEVGRRICKEQDVSWLDLSGNASICAPPGLFIHVEGKPNQFKRVGRPASVFAPKSSRVVRCLLIEPGRRYTQRELAKAAGLDEGFVSRIVRQLERDELIERDKKNAVKVANFGAMLDAWREAYDFSKHHIVRGHIAARSSDEVLRQLAEDLKREKLEHAATVSAGAWLVNQFAGFRLVVFYVAQVPTDDVRQAIRFREESSGENVWLVVPNDEGVFQGTTVRQGIRCAHPVQIYVDLKSQPERAAEAADHLHDQLLNEASHAS
jgi:DNA-binding MarR family transcriptional regulator